MQYLSFSSASFSGSLPAREATLANKIYFHSMLLLYIGDLLPVPVMAINCLSKYRSSHGSCEQSHLSS